MVRYKSCLDVKLAWKVNERGEMNPPSRYVEGQEITHGRLFTLAKGSSTTLTVGEVVSWYLLL